MKHLLKIFCLGFISALMLPAICACGNSGLAVAVDRHSDYVIVYPASATEEELSVYNDFREYLHIKTVTYFKMQDDSVPAEEGVKEILLGNTNRSASAEAYAKLGENQVGYYVSDGNIAIVSNFEGGFAVAYEEFFNRYIKNYSLILDPTLDVRIQCVDDIRMTEVSNLRGIQGDDPCVVHHTDGNYYYCWGAGDGFCIGKIDNLDNIVKDNGVKVYTPPAGTKYSHNYWAPELHYLNGEWYVYVAADDGDNYSHRMYVFKGTSQDPTQPFEFVGQITDPTDKWAIDGAPFEYNGELYFVWSGWEGDENVAQNIYIAHMSDPCTIDSERVLISAPTERFETKGDPDVNEGPAVLVKDGVVTVVYSGSGSWTDDYCLIGLTCTDGNLLNADSWVKSSEPLLSKSDMTYGPGHCFFVKADDGSDWVMYHANLESGTGWSGRSVRIQPVIWDGNSPTFETSPHSVQLPKTTLVIGYDVED